MTLNNNGDLIPEIVRRGFQDLLEAEVCVLTGAQLHERCPDQRSTQRNGIFPNDASITGLVVAVLVEHFEHWQLEGRRMFSVDSMAAIPTLHALPAAVAAAEAITG